MIDTDLSAWVVIPVSLLLVLGGLVTLIGSLACCACRISRARSRSFDGQYRRYGFRADRFDADVLCARRPTRVHELLITLFIVMSCPSRR